MNYIILIICSIFLPVISVKQVTPKLCINCKHFLTDNDTGKFGRCLYFPKKEGKINYLVNGIYQNAYHFCLTAREQKDMCGEEGNHYKEKIVNHERPE
jgi:hypothetical protein